MGFSLRQLLIGVGVVAVYLAITCWHPILGVALLFLFAFPVIALFTSRLRTILLAALPALIVVSLLWAWSYQVSLSVHWGPAATHYQTTIRRGQLLFFRFHYERSNGNWIPWIEGYPEPEPSHWSQWP